MKQYTTPTFRVKIESEDSDVEQILADAQSIIATAAGGRGFRRVSGDWPCRVVDGTYVEFEMDQAGSGIVGSGEIRIEITILTRSGKVLKTSTMPSYIDESVRKKVWNV